MNLGNAEVALKLNDAAIESYNKVVLLHPDNPQAFENLGLVLAQYRPQNFSNELANSALMVLNKKTAVRPIDLCDLIVNLLKHNDIVKDYIIRSGKTL